MIPVAMRAKVNEFLFSFSNSQLYAVIDGASVSGLLQAIDKNNPVHCCLLSGKLPPELARVAPYLIKLDKKSPLTDWLLDGWGQHFGVFSIIDESVSFEKVREHFRSIQIAKNYDQTTVLFRYYDPRVLGIYLPTCTHDEVKQVFGPVKLFVFEGEEANTVQRYWPGLDGVDRKSSSFPLT